MAGLVAHSLCLERYLEDPVPYELERLCCNCHAGHAAEPFQSEFGICLKAPDFEPYLDDILERQDFSRCQDLVLRNRFTWDREVCEDFEPVEEVGEEWSPELTAKLLQLAEDDRLTHETLAEAIAEDKFRHTDWSRVSVDDHVRKLQQARTLEGRREAINQFGFFIGQGNKAAFDALCEYLRALPPASTLEDKALRIDIQRQLARTGEYWRELALLLVEDLFRTASNQTTRGWYSEVFYFFERSCPLEFAEEALRPMLDSPRFSYRIKRRVRTILDAKERLR